MQVKSIVDSTILSTFIKLPLIFQIFVLSILRGSLRQFYFTSILHFMYFKIVKYMSVAS